MIHRGHPSKTSSALERRTCAMQPGRSSAWRTPVASHPCRGIPNCARLQERWGASIQMDGCTPLPSAAPTVRCPGRASFMATRDRLGRVRRANVVPSRLSRVNRCGEAQQRLTSNHSQAACRATNIVAKAARSARSPKTHITQLEHPWTEPAITVLPCSLLMRSRC
jgi:hypothetical protein